MNMMIYLSYLFEDEHRITLNCIKKSLKISKG